MTTDTTNMHPSYVVVSIEGNIGSGKSTLLKYLKDICKDGDTMCVRHPDTGEEVVRNVVFLQEPVDKWATICDDNGVTMLEKFYENKKKYAFAFQMMAYISRLELLQTACREHPDAIIITERSLYTDKHVFTKMLHDTYDIETIEKAIYDEWFHTFSSEFRMSGMVYLKTHPEKCASRIQKRSRDGEGSIPTNYLSLCEDYHESMMKRESVCDYMRHDKRDTEILILDGNNEFDDKKDEWTNDVKRYLGKIVYS